MSFLPQGHLVKLLISSFVVVFFLTACDDKIVSRHYVKTQNTIKIDSIRLISIYPDIQKRLEQSFKNEKLKIDADSIYSIKVDYMDYKKTCNNPMTSAYDATYDGFIRLTLLKNGKRIYMCQKEFRGELSVSGLEKLLTLMRDDLEF